MDTEDRMHEYAEFEDEIVVRRGPSPGISAVLSVVLPGLGQVYSGRLLAGGLWFLAVGFSYWAVLLPGFIAHTLCIWSAFQSAKYWRNY